MKYSPISARRRQIDETLVIRDLFVNPRAAFDFVLAELNGVHPPVINKISDRAYFILSGAGTVRVGDAVFPVSEQDLVFIPKGTIHAVNGKLKYAIITSPPFDPANEQLVSRQQGG